MRAVIALALALSGAGAWAQAPYAPRSAMPPAGVGYVQSDGTIRIVGWDDLAPIFERLDSLFERTHPGTRLAYLKGDLLAPQHSIIFGETALAPTGMPFSTSLNSAYRPLVKAPAFAIRIAHAAVQGDAKLGQVVFIVHPSNPLNSVTPTQLLHIFTVGGRAPDTIWWGQAGVQGALGERRIHTYGLPESDHYASEDVGFGPWLFRDKWSLAHNARAYSMQSTYADVVKRVSEDPAAIGITTANRITPGVKVLGVTPGDWGEPMHGTRDDVLSGRYPFDRYLYVYIRRGPRAPIDPFVKEYMRMVLSKEGQDIIAADAKGYVPLSRAELEAELAKLD